MLHLDDPLPLPRPVDEHLRYLIENENAARAACVAAVAAYRASRNMRGAYWLNPLFHAQQDAVKERRRCIALRNRYLRDIYSMRLGAEQGEMP